MRKSPLESRGIDERRAAFTLIELLAVVGIFALMAAMIIPNVNVLEARSLRAEADQLADRLEFARLRTIVSGKPHRVYIDLDGAAYGLESPEVPEGSAEPEPGSEGETTEGESSVSLAPPREETAVFVPMSGLYGNKLLEAGIHFALVETDQGDTDRGVTTIEFANDGTTDGATIILENDDGDAVFVEVAPLADAVRVFHAE